MVMLEIQQSKKVGLLNVPSLTTDRRKSSGYYNTYMHGIFFVIIIFKLISVYDILCSILFSVSYLEIDGI